MEGFSRAMRLHWRDRLPISDAVPRERRFPSKKINPTLGAALTLPGHASTTPPRFERE
jgi:hypothetical protein